MKNNTCPECGKELTAGSPICLGCGFPLEFEEGGPYGEQTGKTLVEPLVGKESEELNDQGSNLSIECPECSQQIAAGFVFCPHCGCSIDGEKSDSDARVNEGEFAAESQQSAPAASGDGDGRMDGRRKPKGWVGDLVLSLVFVVCVIIAIGAVSWAFGRLAVDERVEESPSLVSVDPYLEYLGDVCKENESLSIGEEEYDNVNNVSIAGIRGSIEWKQNWTELAAEPGPGDDPRGIFFFTGKVVWESTSSNLAQEDFETVVRAIADMYGVGESSVPAGKTSISFENELYSSIECSIEDGSISVTWDYDETNYQGKPEKPNVSPGETVVLNQ